MEQINYSTVPSQVFFDSSKTPFQVWKPYSPAGRRVSKLSMEFFWNQKNPALVQWSSNYYPMEKQSCLRELPFTHLPRNYPALSKH